MAQNPYHVLGIGATASEHEVRVAFRTLAMKYHPDKGGGGAHSGARFAQIQEAYAILKDPIKRRDLDISLHAQTVLLKASQGIGPYHFNKSGTPLSTPKEVMEEEEELDEQPMKVTSALVSLLLWPTIAVVLALLTALLLMNGAALKLR